MQLLGQNNHPVFKGNKAVKLTTIMLKRLKKKMKAQESPSSLLIIIINIFLRSHKENIYNKN